MQTKRADTIADELESLIFSGVFSQGDRLDEVQLAERFSVSRTPIREALQRLALSGLVKQIPRRGVFVHQPGPVELVEMFEVMAEMEAVCARLAATRITQAALAELRAINLRSQAAVMDDDLDRYYNENERFHALIRHHACNSFLEQECQRLHHRLKPFRRVQLRSHGRLKQSMAEHERIVDCLSKGDTLGSADAIRNHVVIQGEKFHYLMTNLAREMQQEAS